MKLEDILKTLRSAHGVIPSDALRAAVPQADAMAPQIWDLNSRFCRGIKLLPDDEHELFYGLHVLAAAKHLPLWSHLVDLARVEPHELEDFFADHAPISLAALMLSVWDGDIDRLLRLIEHADLSDNAKWALFDVLARLTAEGRIPRETTHGFLERYEQEGLADPDSGLWWGWLSAVTCLGLTELAPAIDRVFAKPACEVFNDRDRAEHRDELAMAVAKPGDLALFDRDGIAPVTDPADALAWIERRREYSVAEKAADRGSATDLPHIATDPARDIRLTSVEQHWLRLFLVSRQVPSTAMNLEMLDGFLTALTIGPRMISPEEFFTHVWGTHDGTQPDWDGENQQRYVQEQIARNVEAIAKRKQAGAAHVPIGLEEPDAVDAKEAAADWVDGFLFATELLEDVWQPLFDAPEGLEDTLAIQALVPGDTEYFEREATTKERGEIIARLPEILRRIANFWLSPEKAYPRRQPVRVEKVGRNDPCPCGSGQKYKKCCALKPPPVMH